MKNLTVETWLPVFSGFYGTIWESNDKEGMEMDHINQMRAEGGLAPIGYDDVEWGYDAYHKSIAESVAHQVGTELKVHKWIKELKFQKLHSPREYNFANDSIFVKMTFTLENVHEIAKYLVNNQVEFAQYLKNNYTSHDGFYSGHSNNMDDWILDIRATMSDTHKCGAVLNFMLLNENGEDYESEIYGDTETYIEAKNYDVLVPVKVA